MRQQATTQVAPSKAMAGRSHRNRRSATDQVNGKRQVEADVGVLGDFIHHTGVKTPVSIANQSMKANTPQPIARP